MPKNAAKTSDIFQFLKGGSIKGYKGKLTIQNVKQSEIKSLVFDSAKHINAYKLHIEICKYFYEMHIYDVEKSNKIGTNGKLIMANRVKIFEYAFSTNGAKTTQFFPSVEKHNEYLNAEAVKNALANWNSYISILNDLGDIPVTDEILEVIFKRLENTNYKCIAYSTTSVNGGNTIKVSTTIVDSIVKNINDIISMNYVDIDTSNSNIVISKDNYSFDYTFGRKTFKGNSTNSHVLTDLEQVCTLITIYVGKSHADELTAKNEKTAEGKNATIRKKNLKGVLKTLLSKYEPRVFKLNNPTNKTVLITDIITYFKNPVNSEKIIFDLLLGSSLKKNIKINDVLNTWGFSIINNHNELKVANLIEDYPKHLSLTDATTATDLMDIYAIFGKYILKGIDNNFKDIDPVDLFFFGILFPNVVNEDSDSRTPKVSINPIVDMCLKDLVCYFAQKENSLQRKQSFFKSFDGSLKNLVEYRNKITSKENSLDLSLCDYTISPSQLKFVVFNHMF
jgi:hypothetical protein